jgi:NAD+ synthase (glutamine-hydrolysing)
MRVALAQVNPTVGAVEANARMVIEWMDRARALGADVVAFPELVLTGYPPEDLVFKPAFIEANLRALAAVAARSKGLTAVVGFVDKRDDIFNAAAMLHDGAHVGTYHKHYLPNYGVFDENRYFQAGTESPVFTLGDRVLATNICEDIWYPTGPTTAQALAGADLVISINASPFHAGKGAVPREDAGHAGRRRPRVPRLREHGGRPGRAGLRRSVVHLRREGERVARGRAFEEDLVVADLELDNVFRARLHDSRRRKEKLRSEGSAPRIALPPLPARTRPPLPPRETPAIGRLEETYQALVVGLRDYVRKNGFRHVAVGLSGGIDSALVACIAVEALGAANVTGVTMPSPYSSAGTRRDAARVARHLGIEFLRLPITGVFAAYRRALAKPFKGLKEDVAEENLQARIRGNYLMALSNKFGWLILTTGNKSEIGVGYSTLYGDMAGGFAVIKDVPKTLVYEVSEHVNARAGRELIPRAIFERPPSAELRPGQTDQDSLPPYPVLDAILEAYVEGDQSLPEIVAQGFDEATVRRVIALVDRNEYKRRQGPIGIKITPRAFGRDWRLPIVNQFKE